MPSRITNRKPAGRSTEEVLARFRKLRAKDDKAAVLDAETDVRDAFQQAAAVLHVFALPRLRPLGASTSGDAVAHLIDDTVAAVGWSNEGLRSLKLDVRRRALGELGKRSELSRALEANPVRQRTDVQEVFERWVESGELDLARMSSQELQCVRVLCDWGLERFAGFPAKSEVDRAWHRRSITAPFEALATNFVGRSDELDILRQFVGFRGTSFFRQALDTYLFRKSASFLLLQGRGGVGKTALIARFILEYVDNPRERFAFIYLPFDDFTLDPREPYTLVAAMGSQLETQIAADPEASADSKVAEALAMFRECTRRYLTTRDKLGRRAAKSNSLAARLGSLNSMDREIQEELIRLLRALSRFLGRQSENQEAPALLVLDTFEEVEFRPESDLKLFWQFIDRLAEVPNLRILLSGRGDSIPAVAGRNAQTMLLGDLSEPEAIQLLMTLGVASKDAAAVTRQLGRDPLTLKVAARFMEDTDAASALRGIRTTNYGFFRVGPEVIRGQLYRRMLQHIHDPDVRKLAHPGMVLRRVTPDIIRAFLASECGLGVIDQKRAEELFNELRREHTLVRLDESGALCYREEIRGSMLNLLNADRPNETNRLHLLAADYYAKKRDAIARAEEIYHLLMVETEDKARLERRWGEDLERFLASSSEELPPSSRVWLAEMMSIKVPDDVIRRGRADERERIAGRQVRRAFRLGEFEAALEILGKLPTFSLASPLHASKARTLMALGRSEEALEGLETVIEQYPVLGNQARLAELTWLAAQAALTLRQPSKALEWLERLRGLARLLSSRIALIQALAETLGIAASIPGSDVDTASVREELAAALILLRPDEGEREAGLLRLALGRLGPRPFEPWKLWAPRVAHDLLSSIRDRTTVIPAESVRRISEILAMSGRPYLAKASKTLAPNLPNKLAELAELMLKELMRRDADAAAFAGLAEIFKAENTSLAASTLGGLDDIREGWEFEGGREASV